MVRTPFALLAALAFVLYSSFARAFEPPPLDGHVVDTAGALTADEVHRLDAKLDAARQKTGFAVVVFIPGSLGGESIEDVGYHTARKWGVGSKGADDGVVLLIAPNERKIRIETGKGVGGALTDIECAEIIRDVIGPKMKAGKTYAAVDAGTDRILTALTSDTTSGRRVPSTGVPAKPKKDYSGWILFGVLALAFGTPLLLFVVLAFRTRGRSGSGGSGSSWSSSSSSSSSTSYDWSSSSSSSSSSDSSSSSGYSGGGGDFGGGGASGDY